MSRRVFISFLGTSNYVETIYKFSDNTCSKPVRFIQEALIQKCCKDWTTNDKIYIFCTEGAHKANWKDNGQKTELEIEKIGLEHRLRDVFHLYESIVEMVPIKDGFSEDEVWNIFDAVYDKLDSDDEIYFDVTHAFRSIPLFSTVLFDYSKFMKYTNVKTIQYGAFEKLGPAFEVRKLPVESRVASVLDLTNIIKLQQFTDTANAMLKYGRVKELSELFINEDNQNLKKIGKSLNDFDNYLRTNRLNDIISGQWFKQIKDNMRFLKKSSLPTPIKNIMYRLEAEFKSFVPESSNQNVESAVEWTSKYDMILQSFTLGQEYMITILSEKLSAYNFYENDSEKNFRMYISALFGVSERNVETGSFEGKLADNIGLTKELLNIDWVKKVRPLYGKYSEYRNVVNHAKGKQGYDDIKKVFTENYNNCVNLIKSC